VAFAASPTGATTPARPVATETENQPADALPYAKRTELIGAVAEGTARGVIQGLREHTDMTEAQIAEVVRSATANVVEGSIKNAGTSLPELGEEDAAVIA